MKKTILAGLCLLIVFSYVNIASATPNEEEDLHATLEAISEEVDQKEGH